MMLSLRALLFYTGMALATMIMVPVSLLLLPIPYPRRFGIIANWARFNLWWLKITCRLDANISGRGNIPRAPYIIMCKHQSAWETLAIQLIFPAQAWILKRELLWIPIYGWGLASMQPIAIDRGSAVHALKQLLREGSEKLHRGLCVVIFPEGTRTPPGKRQTYQAGGAMLAAKSGYPIVPVAHNAGHFWPRSSFTKQAGVINMVIGQPIAVAGKSARRLTAEVEAWIEGTVKTLPQP